ncbi:MAG: hypothetical protein HYY90_00880 [Candidatus Omnitrophica bacterium]|nr:hypothetical protein [Candidatus Omnitrophota bacterium]MBI3020794.1 hypothetical protein [Candidatus Omnitrophota bacterium]MBI3082912.1 hypothetical protein [Candidatus Omnitrophota bacterium]
MKQPGGQWYGTQGSVQTDEPALVLPSQASGDGSPACRADCVSIIPSGCEAPPTQADLARVSPEVPRTPSDAQGRAHRAT